ncbi:MAG: Gfo/Idh/MocA family oxidoreductase [Proteobacteria bacterium]|nr:Gfo/Idh/MocA family oxidoreductase [Pseudomonadota bacterium]
MEAVQIRLGIAGLGLAGAFMIRAAAVHPHFSLVAGMDPQAAPREAFARDFSAQIYSDFESLCADHFVDVIYIASPHRFHADQAVRALECGKHVLVEKPLALNLADCDRVVNAVERSQRVLIVGHSHGFDPNVRKMREIVTSGELGRVAMVLAFNYTDYVYRPHGPDESNPELGGGVVFNQVAHQVEIVRAITGQKITALQARVDRLDPGVPTDGASMAFLEFDGGATASLTYSGYGYFDSDEFHDNVSEGGTLKSGGHMFRRLSGAKHQDEGAIRNLAYGARSLPIEQPFLPHFGVIIVTCERGDIRMSSNGILIHDGNGTRHIEVPRGVGRPGQGDALDALWDAVRNGKPCIHDAEWGRDTVAALLAIQRSAKSASRVELGRDLSHVA